MNSIPKDTLIRSEVDVDHTDNSLGYRSWRETAGYSDGDGGLLLTPETYTISLGLDWADTYRPQLEAVRRFLVGEGLKPERIYALGKTNPVWHLRLSNQADLLEALTRLVPFLIKKKKQAEAVIGYLRDEITGEQLVEAFDEAIRVGTRSGYIRSLRMPHTQSRSGKGEGVSPLGAEKQVEGFRKRRRPSEDEKEDGNYTERYRGRSRGKQEHDL